MITHRPFQGDRRLSGQQQQQQQRLGIYMVRNGPLTLQTDRYFIPKDREMIAYETTTRRSKSQGQLRHITASSSPLFQNCRWGWST